MLDELLYLPEGLHPVVLGLSLLLPLLLGNHPRLQAFVLVFLVCFVEGVDLLVQSLDLCHAVFQVAEELSVFELKFFIMLAQR
jgi:hypothetical protein